MEQISPEILGRFDEWNGEKKQIHMIDPDGFYVNEREIWYVKLGMNVGNESNGKQDFRRPVLVVKKVGNLFFVVPMTTKGKDSKFYHTLQKNEYIEHYRDQIPEVSRAQLSQVRIMDKRRFLDRIGYVHKEEFAEIKKKLRELLL
ncbi:MAG: type II toxin-antitoxin system PemK/MazF family toxin [Candidatus Gracilibacteria bacterium]|nr:type II toxin-antitoxin system PemK/MazF family toxin [Candidatus Gracilibacteria bacterium]